MNSKDARDERGGRVFDKTLKDRKKSCKSCTFKILVWGKCSRKSKYWTFCCSRSCSACLDTTRILWKPPCLSDCQGLDLVCGECWQFLHMVYSLKSGPKTLSVRDGVFMSMESMQDFLHSLATQTQTFCFWDLSSKKSTTCQASLRFNTLHTYYAMSRASFARRSRPIFAPRPHNERTSR